MYTYLVPDMTCGHCERAIRNEIEEVDAAAVVEVNLETKAVRVQSQLPESAIQAAIAAAGSQVTPQA
ncbi:MAG: heavy-metal-associated domain-containing protein [Candidatus Sericytochromatia bacterium]|nr:heavy-metal-associated domain-containing protein [Candidatus Sericytochromatia bacterium]